jgi:hypothetical protein
VAVAEAHGHDLLRRRVALLFLVALPLLFYAADAGHQGGHAVETTIVASAFSIVGAGIFTSLAGRSIDSRLLLAGYRPSQLLAGRMAVIGLGTLPILAMTAGLMIAVSHPAHPALVVLACMAVGVVGVPLGFVIGLLVPRELEAVLLLIGVVGVQLSLDRTASLNVALPFGGPRRLAQAALGEPRSVVAALALSLAYSGALLIGARLVTAARFRKRPPNSQTDDRIRHVASG